MKHSARIVLVVISFVSFAASFVVAAESIPFSLKRGIPEIEVIINDSIKAVFAIDTGADHIYIDKTFAEKHGLLSGRTQPMRPTRGSKGITEAKLFNVESLEFGDKAFSDFSMVAIDLVSRIKDTSKGYPDGVLGYSMLKNYLVELNYIDTTIAFRTGDSVETKQVVARIPFVLSRHLIILKTLINDSTNAKMILDTGSSYSIICDSLAQKLNVTRSQSVNKVSLFSKKISSNVLTLVRDLGDVAISVNDKQFEGILGTTFLFDRQIIIDYKNSKLVIFSNSMDEMIELLR